MKFPILSPLAFLIIPLSAQQTLDPIVVSANRLDHPLSKTPYTLSILDEKDLAETFRRTLPEALQYTPGVLIQKTAHGHGSPYIRGFTGRQNLLLVDGIRINNSTYRSGPIQYWNTIDPFSIEHIELIKSQGSVLYGSDAAGGTLNAFTKSAAFREKTDGQIFNHGSTYYEYRSNGQGSHLGRLETQTGIGGKFGIFLGLSAKDFGDIEDSAVGQMRGTGYPEQNLDFKAEWAVTADSTITLAHSYVNQDEISRWHRTDHNPGWTHDNHIAAPGRWNANTYDQERSLTYLRYAGENPESNPLLKRWSATLSHHSPADSEFQDRRGDTAPGSRPIRGSHIDTRTTGIDLHFESPAGPGTLVYGVDYYHDEVDSSGYQTNPADTNRRESLPIADDSQYDLLGTYLQYIWEPTDRFQLTAGARHTYAKASLGRFYDSANAIQDGQSDHWDATVGSLRGLWKMDDHWGLYGGISQAFRAPNLDDLSGNLTAKSGVTSLGSADVEPEEFLTYEIGTRYLRQDLTLNLALFYTDVTNLITGVPVTNGSSTTIATNDGKGYTYGVELEAAWKLHPQWTLSGFLAWQDSRTRTSQYIGGPGVDRPNSRTLPLSGSLALRWTDPTEKYWLEARLLAANTQDRVDPADQAADNQRIPTNGTPSYLVTSLYAGWQATDFLQLNAAIENATDEDYRHHGSGQNEPGTQAILALRITW